MKFLFVSSFCTEKHQNTENQYIGAIIVQSNESVYHITLFKDVPVGKKKKVGLVWMTWWLK